MNQIVDKSARWKLELKVKFPNISRQFENFEIYKHLYGKPFKRNWVALSCFSYANSS